MSLVSCNPVKRVINDKKKLDKVAEVVIRSGYCANDTTYIGSSDTVYFYDTIMSTITEKEIRNDTAYITKTKYRDIIKNILIRDTIKSIIVDSARILYLKGDILKLESKLKTAQERASKYFGWLIFLILCITFALYLRYKR